MTASADSVSWSRTRWILTIIVVVGVQMCLIQGFSKHEQKQRFRPPAPRLSLPETTDKQLQALMDPTLLALGGPQGFSSMWMEVTNLPPVETDWEEPPRWMQMDASKLGQLFLNFEQANVAAKRSPALKLDPQPHPMDRRAAVSPLHKQSTLRALGHLTSRSPTEFPELRSWQSPELLTSSVVQVVVDRRGIVLSATVLKSSGLKEADKAAVEHARKLRFAPVANNTSTSSQTLGQLAFQWHTLPVAPSAGTSETP